jgi:hypothetical protein
MPLFGDANVYGPAHKLLAVSFPINKVEIPTGFISHILFKCCVCKCSIRFQGGRVRPNISCNYINDLVSRASQIIGQW